MDNNLTVKKVEEQKKTFRIVPVLGILTGRVLEEDGYSSIHELMDHFFPGIMTMGSVIMQPIARRAITEQYPFLKDISIPGEDWEGWLKKELPRLPGWLDLTGPIEVDPKERIELAANFLSASAKVSR
jgi:hypothetical protein